MTFDIIWNMQHIQAAYSYFSNKRKERFDVILEPLQAVTQLAFLRFCPIGTKISIDNNLLVLQLPHWHQGLARSWNKDKRDDILLLFNAIQRFNKIYVTPLATEVKEPDSSNETESSQMARELMKLITHSAIAGIDKLISTYSRIDNASVIQTLNMYKNILKAPDRFSSVEEISEGSTKAGKSMEEVFAQIKELWSEHEMALLFHTLKLLETDSANYEIYISGLTTSFGPIQQRIRKWMSDNIVY